MKIEKYLLPVSCFLFWTCDPKIGDEDCAGIQDGSAKIDSCGVCDNNPGNDCVPDCKGVWGGDAFLDDCGICDNDPTNDCGEDCTGLPGGSAQLDSCGICDNDPSNNCIQDCLGIWGGSTICGCTDPSAINYNDRATYDDSTCQYGTSQLNTLWVKTYDVGDESWSVRQVSDGGFIIAGASNFKGLLLKTDQNGELEWSKTYDNSTALYSAGETSDNGFFAVGYYECDSSISCLPDLYMIRTDQDGNTIWEQSDGSGNNNNDWARDFVQNSAGEFYVTGTWNDNGNNSKAMLRKYSSSGELLWAKGFTSSVANEINKIIKTSDGNLLLGGYTGTQHGDYKALMIKTNTDGDQIWKKSVGSTGSTEVYAICESPNGGYIGAGYCNSWRSYFMMERNPLNGNNVWKDCNIVEQSVSGYYAITPTSKGGYYLVDERKIFTWVNDQGEILFSQSIGHANMSIIELQNGDIIVGGYAFIEGGYGGGPVLMRLSFAR
tara:strand:- start:565 stop:2037 length:1473 start_codon:yes stop_codon:yes gene_type:complete